jgi:uncharacterized repeat protein (TIGR01451 family)
VKPILRRHSTGHAVTRQIGKLALSGLLLANAACSAVQRPVAETAQDPFLDESPAIASAADEGNRTGSARLQLSRPGAIQQAQFLAEPRSGGPVDDAITLVAAEPRMPLNCPTCPTGICGVDHEEHFADEYLCDGGDRALPVHYGQQQMLGLETEDTVIEYQDEEGNRKVRPATQVCIYSPRFASVVSVSAPIEDSGRGRPTQALATQRGVGLLSRDVTVAKTQRDMTERLVSRSRGSGLKTNISSALMDAPVAIHGHVHTTTPLEKVGFVQTGLLRQEEAAVIEARVQAAAAWTRNQNPAITATGDAAGELKARFSAAEFVGRENRFNGKSKLRIVKLADKEIAVPGDVVTFTIRFDNVGDREVSRVTIIDNLTPRLEYIEGSATSDLDGRLVADENGEGSLILRWEMDEPLPGRSGGVVTFQTRVR